MRFFVFLIFIFSGGLHLYGQSQEFSFDQLPQEAGLSQSTVNCIMQDSRGYLWIGTANGLNRYDGYSNKIFKRKFNNENCLSGNDIRSLLEDKDGNIWIGTTAGLNVFYPDSGTFRQFVASDQDPNAIKSNLIRSICQDRTGNIWVGTARGGLNKYDREKGSFTAYMHDPKNPKSLSNNYITAVSLDSASDIWIGTWGGGLCRLDIKNESFENYKNDSLNEFSLNSNFIHTLAVDKHNNVWIGTNKGFNKFDRKENKVQSYKSPYVQQDLEVLSIQVMPDDFFWVGSSAGLLKFDLNQKQFSEKYVYGSGPLNDQSIMSLFCDRSGVIWLGTARNGILKMTRRNFVSYRYDPVKFPEFTNNSIWAFAENPDGRVWIGCENNLYFFDPQKNSFSAPYQSIIQSITESGSYVNAICLDKNTLWLGTPNGLLEINLSTGRHHLYQMDSQDIASLSYNTVLCLRMDATGALWIGTSVGLNRLDKRSKKFRRYVNTPDHSLVLAHNSVLSLYVDTKGILWAGTMNGLSRYDAVHDTFYNYRHNPSDRYSLSAPSILSMGEDGSGNLWVGTGSGLNVMDKAKGKFKHIGEENGLPDDMIYGILLDDENNLWVSSNKGLSKLHRDDLQTIINNDNPSDLRLSIRNYDQRDGLQGNEFNAGAFLKTRSGELYFGGLMGFSRFFPSRIRHNAQAPRVLITSVKQFDKEIHYNLNKKSSFEMLYDENTLSFEFIALDYVASSKNQYAYRLEGVDNGWNYTSTRRYATYSNLNPGKYVFQVKGSNNDLVWSSPVTMNITIFPPFWKTWWFYTLSFLTLAAVSIFLYKYRVRKHIKATIEIEKVRRMENERVRKKASDDFHDEFGHTLTKIAMLAEILKKDLPDTNSDNALTLQKIIETSKMLSTGMRDFLWALNPAKDTFAETAIRIKDFGDELFDRTETAFFVDQIPDRFETIHLSMQVRRHLILIFKEAMHNILKHSKSKKAILSYSMENNKIIIRLYDNGIGWNGNGAVHGIGLRSMHRRAREINGQLDISSKKGEGTAVTFLLDISQTKNGV